jgi:hypothetical protein
LTGISAGVSGSDVYLNDGNKIYMGDDNDGTLYHSGTHLYLDNATGDTFIRVSGTEIAVKCTHDGATTLYYNGLSRLSTTVAGVSVVGDLLPNDDIYLTSTGRLYLGDFPHLSIYHNNSHSYWDNITGNVYIRTNGASEDLFVGVPNAGVTLFHNDVAKFATIVTGIEVTGSINIDSIPGTNLTASGITTTMTVEGNTQGFGSALYMTSGGNGLNEIDADTVSTMPCRALALETGTGSKSVLLRGFIRDNSWGWTPGLPMYASTTVGTMTQARPTGSGDQVQIVGWAHASNVIYFDPDKTVVEIA